MVDVKSRKIVVSARDGRKVRLAFRWGAVEALHGANVLFFLVVGESVPVTCRVRPEFNVFG